MRPRIDLAHASARVATVIEALRALTPPVIDHATLAALQARGRRIRDNVVQPDERTPVVFTPDLEFLIHRLRFDLSDAISVGVTVTVEETGTVLLDEPSAPFDRDSEEVLIACQRDFQRFPPHVEGSRQLKRLGNGGARDQ